VLKQVVLWLTIALVISGPSPIEKVTKTTKYREKTIKYKKLFLCFAKLKTDVASSFSKASKFFFDF
jgi:hypothetical protein